MGIEVLEKKYQTYIACCPQHVGRLREIAHQVAVIQQNMRDLFDQITPALCSTCQFPCCKSLPVEGWFTECDYILYRLLYDAPFALLVKQSDGKSCSFLGANGCMLPPNMRPFPCVKVNCRKVMEELEARGFLTDFHQFYCNLERLQDEVYPLLADILSYSVLQAQSL